MMMMMIRNLLNLELKLEVKHVLLYAYVSFKSTSYIYQCFMCRVINVCHFTVLSFAILFPDLCPLLTLEAFVF